MPPIIANTHDEKSAVPLPSISAPPLVTVSSIITNTLNDKPAASLTTIPPTPPAADVASPAPLSTSTPATNVTSIGTTSSQYRTLEDAPTRPVEVQAAPKAKGKAKAKGWVSESVQPSRSTAVLRAKGMK